MMSFDEMMSFDDLEREQKSYMRKKGFKMCNLGKCYCTIKSVKCKHLHCRKCGLCQAVNGCKQIIKR